MLEQIKHNKIKNTGIIYEVLVGKMIEQAVYHKKPIAYSIFNNYFNKDKMIFKQLQIYNLLTNTQYQSQDKATTLFEESLKLRMRLDQIRLDKEKYFIIKQMKKHYDIKELFGAKISNYKVYASIYKVFQSLKSQQYNPINIVQSKYKVIQFMLKPMRQQILDQDLQLFKQQSMQIKEKTLQVFVEKFNEKYDTLNENQKNMLKKYTYSVSNKEINEYMDIQINRILQVLDSESDKVKSIIESVDKLKKIKVIQDKMYLLLNLYQIEKIQNEHISD